MTSATCDQCGRVWNVPTEGKVYRCKECGGRVSTEPAAATPPLAPASPKPSPSPVAINPYAAAEESAPGSVADHLRSIMDPQFLAADQALAKAKILALPIQILFGLLALGVVVLAVLFFAVGLAAGGIGGDGLAKMLFVFIAIGGPVVAVFRVTKEPAVWAVVVAAQFTILLLTAVILDTPHWVNFVLAGLSWIGLWLGLRLAAHLRKHPETQLVAELEQRRATPEAIDPNKKRRKPVRKPTPAAAQIAGGALVMMSFMPLLMVEALSTPEVNDAAEAFASAWNADDDGSLRLWLVKEDRKKLEAEIKEKQELRQWDLNIPKLGEPKVTASTAHSATVSWTIGKGDLTSHWIHTNYGWTMRSIRFPAQESPPITPTARQFIEDWKAGDHPTIANHLRGEPTRNTKRIQRSFERQGWMEQLPEIIDYRVEDGGNARAKVWFRLQEGEIYTRWVYGHGVWRIRSLKWPKDS